MKYKLVRDRCCQNEKCQDHGKFGRGNIIRHSKYKTRQGTRMVCQSRHKDLLDDYLALQMCYYNFVRPHSALKFGDETRTPAMQAGLVKKQLSFQEIFIALEIPFLWFFKFLRTQVRVEKFFWSPVQ